MDALVGLLIIAAAMDPNGTCLELKIPDGASFDRLINLISFGILIIVSCFLVVSLVLCITYHIVDQLLRRCCGITLEEH